MTDVAQDQDQDYEDGQDVYVAEPLDDGIEELRPREIEGRTSWIYLGLLGVIFVLLVVFSWACNDRSDIAGEPMTDADAAEAGVTAPVELDVQVAGDVVSMVGAVPDEAARDQVLITAGDVFGPENVIDELVIDPSRVFDDGSARIFGSASFGDTRPEALQQALAGLGLGDGGLEIDRGDGSVDPVALEARLSAGMVDLIGVVPDDTSVTDLVAAIEAVYGAGTARTDGLVVGDASWGDGAVRVTGSSRPGDSRYLDLGPELQRRFGALVTVDTSEVTVDLGPEALADIQDDIAAQLVGQPIRFAPLLAEIEAESDAVIEAIAGILQTIPEVSVEVVGHTDSAGSEADNQVLSEQRAAAVVERLVELGVDEARLNARGEGEAIPIADNTTAEGREQNRRIEFILVAG
ncbi:MAG: OmpA family protein [Actinomycetota bacterium]